MARLAIIGTGFVGTSLALALRPSKLFDQIAGYDTERSRTQEAKLRGAIDEDSRSAGKAVEGAAVVVVTVPSAYLQATFREIGPSLAAGAVVTDTTLWKGPAIEAARSLPAEVHFISGRPVLDSTGHGPAEARADVFTRAVYCVAPHPEAQAAAIDVLHALIEAVGAQAYFTDPSEHDAQTAGSELLPPAMVAAVALAVSGDTTWRETGRLASDTLSQMATMAEDLDPVFWHQAIANKAALTRWLDTAMDRLMDMREWLDSKDAAEISRDWDSTKEALVRWRGNKRTLQEGHMPSKDELRPNFLGTIVGVDRWGKLRPRD